MPQKNFNFRLTFGIHIAMICGTTFDLMKVPQGEKKYIDLLSKSTLWLQKVKLLSLFEEPFHANNKGEL